MVDSTKIVKLEKDNNEVDETLGYSQRYEESNRRGHDSSSRDCDTHPTL